MRLNILLGLVIAATLTSQLSAQVLPLEPGDWGRIESGAVSGEALVLDDSAAQEDDAGWKWRVTTSLGFGGLGLFGVGGLALPGGAGFRRSGCVHSGPNRHNTGLIVGLAHRGER